MLLLIGGVAGEACGVQAVGAVSIWPASWRGSGEEDGGGFCRLFTGLVGLDPTFQGWWLLRLLSLQPRGYFSVKMWTSFWCSPSPVTTKMVGAW